MAGLDEDGRIGLDEADRLVRAGALWGVPGLETHWLRLWDGVAVRILRWGEVRPTCASWRSGSWVLSVGGSRRGLARLMALALGVDSLSAKLWTREIDGPKWPDVFGELDSRGIVSVLAPEVEP